MVPAARTPNPFRPGFNQAPLALAGREPILAAVREALAVAALDGRTPRPVVLTGGRGVGKTVLLGEAAAIAAEEHSWLTVPVEVRPDRSFTPYLVDRLTVATELYRQARTSRRRMEITGATVRATVLGVGAELELSRDARPEPADVPRLDRALAAALAAALEQGAGLVLTVDELQLAARAELADLAATLQQHVPDDWPLVVILAGLPSLRDAQRESRRAVTYLERGEWHVLGLLDPTATVEALAEPARQAGRPMTDSACALLAGSSGGYPYAIQVLGHHAWRASAGSATIEVHHARAAAAAAEADLAAGLYTSRWHGASPKEQEYLVALAEVVAAQGVAGGADVARALGRTTQQVSYLRDRLIRKGTIFAEAGRLVFAVPGMADWVLAQRP
jgi:AAA ATPase domain